MTNERRCTKCKLLLPLTCFYKARKWTPKIAKDMYLAWCKQCRKNLAVNWKREKFDEIKYKVRKYARDYYRANKPKIRFLSWKHNLKKWYGITPEIYEQMFKSQNGACAICLEQNLDGQRLCVDHDHANGKVRKLLCKSCNVGIARFREKPELLDRAIEYLREHDRTSP